MFLVFCLLFLMCCNNTIQKEQVEFYTINPLKTTFLGTVKFQHISNLSFQENGILTYIPFTKGDFVKKGQLVAKIDDTLYIDSPRKAFLPSYVYYLLEYHKCDKVCFANSRTIYEKESLKGKEDWKEIK